MLNNRPKSSHHLLCPSTVSLRVPLNKKENVATPRHAVFCPRSAPESRGVVSLSYMMWRSNFGCQQWQNEAPWDWQLKEKTKQQTRWIEWMRKCFLNSSNYSGYVYVSAFNTKLTQLPGGLGYQFNAMPGLTFVTVEPSCRTSYLVTLPCSLIVGFRLSRLLRFRGALVFHHHHLSVCENWPSISSLNINIYIYQYYILYIIHKYIKSYK